MSEIPNAYISSLRAQLHEVTDRDEFRRLLSRFDSELRSHCSFPTSAQPLPANAPFPAPRQDWLPSKVDYSQPIYSRYDHTSEQARPSREFNR